MCCYVRVNGITFLWFTVQLQTTQRITLTDHHARSQTRRHLRQHQRRRRQLRHRLPHLVRCRVRRHIVRCRVLIRHDRRQPLSFGQGQGQGWEMPPIRA